MTEEDQMSSRNEILDRIKQILGEHFTGFVLAVEAEIDDPGCPEKDGDSGTIICYGGGFNKAYGLVARTKRQFEVNGYLEYEDDM